jgi:hypothetical protein
LSGARLSVGACGGEERGRLTRLMISRLKGERDMKGRLISVFFVLVVLAAWLAPLAFAGGSVRDY